VRSSGGSSSGRRGARGVVAALCLIQFVDVLGVTVVITALPVMLRDVGGTPADGTLVATGYAMFFGSLLMFGARLGDRMGHRRAILIGLVLFAGGSLLAATSTSVVLLTAGRCVQGAAAAVAVPSALALLTTVATCGGIREAAIAAWGATGAAAGAAGFVVGGALTDLAGWRVIFWGLLAVAAAQTAAILAVVPADRPRGEGRALNLTGSVLLTGAVMLLVVGATVLGGDGSRARGVLLVVAAGAVGACFVVVDRRSDAPLLPRALVRTPQVLSGTTGSFVNTATTGAVATLITLYLQSTLGRTPLQAAATLLPLSVAVVGGSAAAAKLAGRLERERITALGLALIAGGIAVPLVAPASALLVGSGVAVAGVGLGLSAVATTSMGTDVDEASRATASGLINTSAQLGQAIGTAFILLIAAATTGVPDRTTGTPVVGWAAAALLAGVTALAFARLRPARIPA
jgi:MFS family permease